MPIISSIVNKNEKICMTNLTSIRIYFFLFLSFIYLFYFIYHKTNGYNLDLDFVAHLVPIVCFII